MGELLLCGREMASMPYYMEHASLNIYSLEELCYYLKCSIDAVGPEFMEEELCRWIESELSMPKLAKQLLLMIATGKSLSQFAGAIMHGCGYCTDEEIALMQQALSVFENKQEHECRKIRADRMVRNKKYAVGILEYQKLIGEAQEMGYGERFLGSIWHNLGTAFAGMFFFEEAADCYGQAFLFNQNPDSKRQQQEALRLRKVMDFEEDFEDGLDDNMQECIAEIGNGNLDQADEMLCRFRQEYLYSSKF